MTAGLSDGRGKRFGNDGLGLRLYLSKMLLAAEAFGIDFVDIFSAGGTRREPSTLGDDFDATDGATISRRVRQNCQDFFTGQIGAWISPLEILSRAAFCRVVAGASVRS